MNRRNLLQGLAALPFLALLGRRPNVKSHVPPPPPTFEVVQSVIIEQKANEPVTTTITGLVRERQDYLVAREMKLMGYYWPKGKGPYV